MGPVLLSVLVALLGSPRYPVREAAEVALARSMPASRPALEAAARSADPEVVARAARVVGAFDNARWDKEADSLYHEVLKGCRANPYYVDGADPQADWYKKLYNAERPVIDRIVWRLQRKGHSLYGWDTTKIAEMRTFIVCACRYTDEDE